MTWCHSYVWNFQLIEHDFRIYWMPFSFVYFFSLFDYLDWHICHSKYTHSKYLRLQIYFSFELLFVLTELGSKSRLINLRCVNKIARKREIRWDLFGAVKFIRLKVFERHNYGAIFTWSNIGLRRNITCTSWTLLGRTSTYTFYWQFT